jgi:hypothetical protein
MSTKTWPYTLRVEHRWEVLENRLLRSIYDLMRMGSGRRENKIAY